MIERSVIEEMVGRIRTYRGQLSPLPESKISGWNERPQRYCEFVESNLFYLLYRVPSIQQDHFVQTLAQEVKEIKDFASHILLHGTLDEAEREQERAIADAMDTVQRILADLYYSPCSNDGGQTERTEDL